MTSCTRARDVDRRVDRVRVRGARLDLDLGALDFDRDFDRKMTKLAARLIPGKGPCFGFGRLGNRASGLGTIPGMGPCRASRIICMPLIRPGIL